MGLGYWLVLTKEGGATRSELRRRKRKMPRSPTRARPMTPPTTPPAMAPTFVDLEFWVPSPPVLPLGYTVVIGPEVVVLVAVLTSPVRVVGPLAVPVDSGPAGARIGSGVLSLIREQLSLQVAAALAAAIFQRSSACGGYVNRVSTDGSRKRRHTPIGRYAQ